jgi:hypothetical protein
LQVADSISINAVQLFIRAHNETLSAAMHACEVRPRKDHRGIDLISDALPFGRLWYLKVSDAIGYAQHRSRSHDALIRVYDESGNVIQTNDHNGKFKEW